MSKQDSRLTSIALPYVPVRVGSKPANGLDDGVALGAATPSTSTDPSASSVVATVPHPKLLRPSGSWGPRMLL